jgi:predicted RNase H-like nuclease (RuvC/YqgF family)
MTEEIINPDGSRNWQANILLDNIKRLEQERNDLQDRLLTLADTYQETRNVCKSLEQENKRLKKLRCKFKEYCTCDIEKYRSALEEIQKIITADCKGCTAECDCDDDCTRYRIKNKINEVLQ